MQMVGEACTSMWFWPIREIRVIVKDLQWQMALANVRATVEATVLIPACSQSH